MRGQNSWPNAQDMGSVLGGKEPLKKETANPTPVFLPEKLYGQRSLVAKNYGVTKSQTHDAKQQQGERQIARPIV